MSEFVVQLEERVQRAARRLRELGAERQRLEAENADLRARLRGLEAQIRPLVDPDDARLARERSDTIAVLEAVARDLRGEEAAP
jgi:septal ring factor EnvC (AmiA/AmiB activator)